MARVCQRMTSGTPRAKLRLEHGRGRARRRRQQRGNRRQQIARL